MGRVLILLLLSSCGRIGFDAFEGGSAPVEAARGQLSVGGVHSCAVRGTDVWCWGDGTEGEGGTGSTGIFPIPVKVANLPPVTMVSSGSEHSCALTEAGTVYCWGYNGYGQTGPQAKRRPSLLAPPFEDPTADPVPGLPSKAIEISCGGYHSCALLDDHRVFCWGRDSGDPLGRNQSVIESMGGPVVPEVNPTGAVLQLPATVAHLSADDDSTCALDLDGSVWCWGENGRGQLGTRTTDQQPLPFHLPSITATDISLGGDHLCVLREDHHVSCWGSNDHGELGLDSNTSDQSLTPITTLETYLALDSGSHHTCAIAGDNTVECWGADALGQAGGPSFDDFFTPTTVETLSNIVAISAGEDVTCALRNDDSVKCWGNGRRGNLGDGTVLETLPQPVPNLTGVASLAGGDGATCSLGNGIVNCWGENHAGQLGDGTTGYRLTPAPTLTPWSPDTVTAIAMGFAHVCAITSPSNDVYCWGDDGEGQLGDGTNDDKSTPVKVSVPNGATSLALGGNTSCARTTTNQVFCWGDDSHGQLGDGAMVNRNKPNLVGGGFLALSAGNTHVCGIDAAGVECWGQNEDGQLGDGTQNDRSMPSTVPVLNATVLWTGGASTCAGGTTPTQCWGLNEYSTLMGGTMEQELSPILSMQPATASANKFTTCFTTASTIQCIGSNSTGQIGDGTFDSTDVPVIVGATGSSLPVDVAVGDEHVCAAFANGSVACWGDNTFGQLGLGTQTRRATPVAVAFP